MKMLLGYDYFGSKNGQQVPVEFDTNKLINPHMLILGASGVGKSWTFRRLIRQGRASAPAVRFHVFDVHGDLEIEDASVVQYSEVAPFGLNPLRVNPSPEFGGVRKCIQAFIRIINQASSTALGVKQESVLRNLLLDVYRDFGFEAEDPSTWSLNALESRLLSAGADNRLYLVVPMEDKEKAKSMGARWEPTLRHWWVPAHTYKGELTQWSPAHKTREYPSVADVTAYARRLHEEKFLGSDQAALRALMQLNKTARNVQRKALDAARLRKQNIFDGDAQEELEVAGAKAVDAYTDYVKSIRTGYELETLLKYDSPDVLKGVLDRLSNLTSTGIFKTVQAPFDPNKSVWRYKLNTLGMEEKKMMVLFLLQDLFNRAMERGEQKTVVEVAVLDELSTYTGSQDDDGDGIIGVVARQARKFGLGLWAADQSPAGIPASLTSSLGTKIILGVDELYWNDAVSKLRMESKLVQWISPQVTMAAQLKEAGSTKNRWWWVVLPKA
jgi:hypothetical protein